MSIESGRYYTVLEGGEARGLYGEPATVIGRAWVEHGGLVLVEREHPEHAIFWVERARVGPEPLPERCDPSTNDEAPNDQIRQWQTDIHAWARGKGFYDDPRTLGDCIALMHSELSEALEAYRESGHTRRYFVDERGERVSWDSWQEINGIIPYTQNKKWSPEGVGPELADCVIRILDTCEFLDIDLSAEIALKMAYNEGRPYRHGKRAL